MHLAYFVLPLGQAPTAYQFDAAPFRGEFSFFFFFGLLIASFVNEIIPNIFCITLYLLWDELSNS